MTKFLTEETPVKVVSLLGVVMTSLMFLFLTTNMTSGQAVPDPFAPEKVVAVLDTVSNSYTAFLNQNLFQPAQAQYAFVSDNVGFVADNAGPEILRLVGLQGLATTAQASSQPEVAGASSVQVASKYYPSSSGPDMFSFLLGK